jgi:hypothetical protein
LRREIRDRLIGESPELLAANVTSFIARVSVPTNLADEDFDFAATIESRLNVDRQERETALRESFWSEITASKVRLERIRTGAGQLAPLSIARLPAAIETGLEAFYPGGDSPLHHEAQMLLLSTLGDPGFAARSPSGELIIVPVNIATLLERRSRESWLKIARGVEGVGKARLMLEIQGLSKDMGVARLSEIATRCAPFFRAIAIELASCTDTSLALELPSTVRMFTLMAPRAFSGQNLSPAFLRMHKAASMKTRQFLIKEASPVQAKTLVAAGVGLLAETLEPR